MLGIYTITTTTEPVDGDAVIIHDRVRSKRRAYARFNDLTYIDSPDFVANTPDTHHVSVEQWRGLKMSHELANASIDSRQGIPTHVIRHYTSATEKSTS